MHAIVFRPTGEQLELRPDPTPQPDEVLVKIEYCGICGSDLHAAEPDFIPGTVMGHEFSATVLEPGRDVTGFRPGDPVVINPNGGNCGHCPQCREGAVNLCQNIWPTVVGLARDGGLAPYAAVRASLIHRLPPHLDLESAALTEPLAVALRAVRNSGFSVGQDAVIFGGGPIGLLITTILHHAGATRLTVVEPSPARRDMAFRQGASHVLDPAVDDVSDTFADPARAPQFAFECSGVPELVGQALRAVRPRGIVTVSGFSRRPPTFNATDLLHKEASLRGSFIYTAEFDEAIDLLGSGKIDVKPLISGVVPINEAAVAFDQMRHSVAAIKYLIRA